MNDLQTVWERYVSSWKAPAAEKRELFAACLSPDCVYTDPLTSRRGWDELTSYMSELQQQLPGAYFVTQQFFSHHGRSIARWNMLSGAGQVVGEGVSYGEYDERGRLVTMTGFFATPEPATP